MEFEVALDCAGKAGLLRKLTMDDEFSKGSRLMPPSADAKSEAKSDSFSILSIPAATDSGTSLAWFSGVTGDCNAG